MDEGEAQDCANMSMKLLAYWADQKVQQGQEAGQDMYS